MKLVKQSLIFAFIILVSYGSVRAADSSTCGDWIGYKDEKCFKILDDTMRVFDEAEKACANLEDSPTLSIIHSKEEQDFLENYIFKTQKKVENVWIGARFSDKFHWVDNSDLAGYTNWIARGTKNKTNSCVQMSSEEESIGKWIDEPCEKKGLVVCQKLQSWSIVRLQKTLLEARKQFTDFAAEATNKINQQKHELDEANKRISENKQNLVPIGFIYPQMPNENSPAEIWPWMKWTDVSASYAGVFFRVTGGDAAAFGQVQQDNAPRLEHIFTTNRNHLKTQRLLFDGDDSGSPIPKSGWSDNFFTGNNGGGHLEIFMNFKLSAGEVRPRNMAIRIWKRTG